MCQRNIEPRSHNHRYRGKAICVTYCECVFVALGIQHPMRTRRIVLPSAPCLAVPCFFHSIS